MFRRLLSTYPKYTVYSSQYRSCTNNKTPTWGELSKKDTGLDTIEYGFKREIVPSDLKYKEPKNDEVENWDEYLKKKKKKTLEASSTIWEGWIP